MRERKSRYGSRISEGAKTAGDVADAAAKIIPIALLLASVLLL